MRLKMKKWWIIAAMLLWAGNIHLSAQTEPEQDTVSAVKEKKWRFYGGLGLSWYNNVFNFQIYPGVLYKTAPRWYTGGGLYYAYLSSRTIYGASRSHIYGGSVLTAYTPWKFVETSLEYQYLWMRQYFEGEVYHRESPALFIGVGYRMRHAIVGFRYDILYKEGRSFYRSPLEPFIRIYF